MRSRVPHQELELFSRVPLFSRCSRHELRSIARLGTPLEVREGTELTKEGAPGFEFFLVLEGKVACSVAGRQIAELGSGEFFGELSLLDGKPRSATVTAVGPTRVLVLSASEFATLLQSAPSITVKLLAALSERLRRTRAAALH